MAGGLASKGGADVGLSSVQHPTHAMPGHCTQRNEIISQFVAPYFAPSTSSPLPCKLDGQSAGSVASSHTSSETISPRSSCPCPEIFSIQNTPSFCCTSHYTLTFSLLHQSCSLWLILSKSQHTALPQERSVLLEDPVLEKHRDYSSLLSPLCSGEHCYIAIVSSNATEGAAPAVKPNGQHAALGPIYLADIICFIA